jgi:hypothetical protein
VPGRQGLAAILEVGVKRAGGTRLDARRHCGLKLKVRCGNSLFDERHARPALPTGLNVTQDIRHRDRRECSRHVATCSAPAHSEWRQSYGGVDKVCGPYVALAIDCGLICALERVSWTATTSVILTLLLPNAGLSFDITSCGDHLLLPPDRANGVGHAPGREVGQPEGVDVVRNM